MPDPKQPVATMIRIENRSRSTWVFEATTPNPKPGRRPIPDPANDLVIGDAFMTPQVMASLGARYDRRCPAPVVTVPKSVIDALDPKTRAVLQSLVDKGDFQFTPVAA